MSFNKCKSPKTKSRYQNFVDCNAENRCYQPIDMRAVLSKILHTEPHVLLRKPGTWIILLNQIRLIRDFLYSLPFLGVEENRASVTTVCLYWSYCVTCFDSSTQPPSGKKLLKEVPMCSKPRSFHQLLQANSHWKFPLT